MGLLTLRVSAVQPSSAERFFLQSPVAEGLCATAVEWSPMPSRVFPLIKHSPCPNCGGPMMLSCIEPADLGYNRHSFRCAACRYQYSVKLRIEGASRPFTGPAAEGAVVPLKHIEHCDDGAPVVSAIDLVSGRSKSDDVTLH